jgi:hypothetical protein
MRVLDFGFWAWDLGFVVLHFGFNLGFRAQGLGL